MSVIAQSSESKRTLKREDLAKAARRVKTSASADDIRAIVDGVFDEIASELATSGHVGLSGLGVFDVRSKKARMGRNPKTNVEHVITPRRVVTFKSSGVLVARLNGKVLNRHPKP